MRGRDTVFNSGVITRAVELYSLPCIAYPKCIISKNTWHYACGTLSFIYIEKVKIIFYQYNSKLKSQKNYHWHSSATAMLTARC